MVNTFQEKQGYKYTEEFGYIPKDWNIEKVATKTNVVTGGTPSTKVSDYWNGSIKWMSSGELNNKRIYDVEGRITPLGLANSSTTLIPENSILIGLAGQGKTRGTAAINYVELSTNQSIGAILPSKYFNSEFLYQCIDKRYDELRELSSGGGGRGGLNKALLMNLSILLPPLPEQEKIAEVLGDIDSLIDNTQQLVNKKKDIKTATMQKLLTPKEDWVERKIGEITPDIYQPQTISQSVLSSDGYPVYGANGIIGYYSKYNHITPQITVTCRGSTCGTINLTLPYSWITGNAMVINIDKVDFNKSFLYYLLSYADLTSLITGSGQPQIIRTSISEFKLFCPCNTKEQEKIATILSDMDAEIETLEKELNKYKDLKTGMMQQLLTGKIRLLNQETKQDDNIVSFEHITSKKVANDEFKDAILISMLAYKYGTEQYPLGAFRRQKLSYFYKRHANMNIDEYTKKAMGPYNSKLKYQGAENIAIRNGYVKNVGGRGIVATDEISKVKEYYNRYYKPEDMQWLDANFHYENNNNLEVLATVDYAINDLVSQNKAITLNNIKTYIASDKEWRPKLELDYFTDNAIIKAMEKIKKLFNSY